MLAQLFRVLFALIFIATVSQVRAQQVAGSSPVVDEKTDKSTASNKGASSISDKASSIADPLVRILVDKGLLTTDEAHTIGAKGTPSEQRDRLAGLLRCKGVIINLAGSDTIAVTLQLVAVGFREAMTCYAEQLARCK